MWRRKKVANFSAIGKLVSRVNSAKTSVDSTSHSPLSTHDSPLTMPALNKYSSHVTQPKSQGASQAMLYGTGTTPDDMNKAQVGIASVWYEGNTCNMHLNKLAEEVKEGVDEAG